MEGHPIEFVSKGQEITFYILEDDGKSPTPTKGFGGRAVIQDGGKTIAVALVAGRAQHVCRTASDAARLEGARGVFRESAGPHPPGAIHDGVGQNMGNHEDADDDDRSADVGDDATASLCWRLTRFLPLLLLALAVSTPAFAHSEQGEAIDFWGGFTHPIFGLDHVVAMVAVGLWGAFLGAPAIWLLPVVFPLVMAVAGALGVLRRAAARRGDRDRPFGHRAWRDGGVAPQSRRYGSRPCWSAHLRSFTAMPMAPNCRSGRTLSRFPWASSSPPECFTLPASLSAHCPIGRPDASPCGRPASSLP